MTSSRSGHPPSPSPEGEQGLARGPCLIQYSLLFVLHGEASVQEVDRMVVVRAPLRRDGEVRRWYADGADTCLVLTRRGRFLEPFPVFGPSSYRLLARGVTVREASHFADQRGLSHLREVHRRSKDLEGPALQQALNCAGAPSTRSERTTERASRPLRVRRQTAVDPYPYVWQTHQRRSSCVGCARSQFSPVPSP
jgi:hypothetical protein